MQPARVLVLGMLNHRGPMHGYEIRRRAEFMNVEEWGGVKVGSLYAAIRRMAIEGLIREERTERAGRFPARTVYSITPAGQDELGVILERCLRTVVIDSDPFGVALTASFGPFLMGLPAVVEERERVLQASLAALVERRERLDAAGQLRMRARATFLHTQLRIETELRFHAELAEMLPDLLAEGPAPQTPRDHVTHPEQVLQASGPGGDEDGTEGWRPRSPDGARSTLAADNLAAPHRGLDDAVEVGYVRGQEEVR